MAAWRRACRSTGSVRTEKSTRSRRRAFKHQIERLEDRCVPTAPFSFEQLPLAFEINQGQAGPGVDYVARGPGYSLTLTAGQAVLGLSKTDGSDTSDVVQLSLVGADPLAAATGVDPRSGRVNYYVGNDPARWHTGIPTFGKVSYQNILPGIDIVYYGNQGQLEYDLIAHPGANPSTIHFSIAGAQSISVDAQGDLLLHTSGGDVVEHAPVIYQDVGGVRQSVSGRYVLQGGNTVGFDVGAYDPTQALTIDPVLNYSSYIGGGGADQGLAITADSNGLIYVTGQAGDTTFPIKDPESSRGFGGASDAFVAVYNPAKTGTDSLVYETLLGGPEARGASLTDPARNGADAGYAVATDGFGDAFITGQTSSSNFPLKNYLDLYAPIQVFNGGSFDFRDAFVAGFGPDGKLAFSTYLGGGGDDAGRAIAVDPTDGSLDVAGDTFSTDFPGAVNSLSGLHDIFLAKITRFGGVPELGPTRYLGGTGEDHVRAMALDQTGNIYLTGTTNSTNFPTATPFQGALLGATDAFVTRLTPSGSLTYSTYLGGTADESGNGIAVDTAGNIYVGGSTVSTDFPTAGSPFQSANAGGQDGFITKLSPAGVSAVYSTYLGGQGNDSVNGLAFDPATDAVFAAGGTGSSNFPTANALQWSLLGKSDGFVTELDATGSSLQSSTYLGGSSDDTINGIASDHSGNAYFVGTTTSGDLPSSGDTALKLNGKTGGQAPAQPLPGGGSDAFVGKLIPGNVFRLSMHTATSPKSSVVEGDTTFYIDFNSDRPLFGDQFPPTADNFAFRGFWQQINDLGQPIGDAQPIPGSIFFNSSATAEVVVPATFVGDEGSFLLWVVDATSGRTNALRLNVVDAPLSDMTQPTTLTAIEGQPPTDYVVATFRDDNPNGTPTDFKAQSTIDWGDGTTDVPTNAVVVQRFPDHVIYALHGRHQYLEDRATPYQVKVSIQDKGGASLVSQNTQILVTDAALTDTTPQNIIQASEGNDTGLITLATFTDANPNAVAGDFSARLDWGDGSTQTPSVVSTGGGQFAVQARHTYLEEDQKGPNGKDLPYIVRVSVQNAGGAQFTATGTQIQVADAALTDQTSQRSMSSVVGVDTPPLLLGIFTDANANAPLSDFTGPGAHSNINWGDGSTSAPIIQLVSRSGNAATFEVLGEHAYNLAGTYSVHVSVVDAGGATLVIDLSETAEDVTVLPVSAVEGSQFKGVVGTFKDPNAKDSNGPVTAGTFTATIDWGDGQTSTGTVVDNNQGGFNVLGTHTYTEDQTTTVKVTLGSDPAGKAHTASGTATVFDAPLTAGGNSFNAGVDVGFSGVVATFTDGSPAGKVGDFTATIAWGDGSTSAGTIAAGNNGTFMVTGKHTYLHVADYQTSISIRDQGGATATATGTAHVGFAPPPNPGSGTVPVPGTGNLAAVSTPGSSVVFVINPNGSLLRHDAGGWVKLGDFVQQISASVEASGNPVVFAVTQNHALARFDPLNGWQLLGAPGTVQSVSAGTDLTGHADAFILSMPGDLLEYRGSSGWLPTVLGARGTILSMSAADNDRVVVVTASHAIAEFDLRLGWFALTGPGFAQSVSAAGESSGRLAVFAVSADNALWVHEDGGSWAKIGGSGSILAASAGTDQTGAGTVGAVTATGALAEYHLRSGWGLVFPGIPQGVTQLNATAVDRLFFILADGSVDGSDAVAGVFPLAGAGFAQP